MNKRPNLTESQSTTTQHPETITHTVLMQEVMIWWEAAWRNNSSKTAQMWDLALIFVSSGWNAWKTRQLRLRNISKAHCQYTLLIAAVINANKNPTSIVSVLSAFKHRLEANRQSLQSESVGSEINVLATLLRRLQVLEEGQSAPSESLQ